MISRRPDILADVPLRRRLEREQADGRYLASHKDSARTASKESLQRDANTWAGIDTFAADNFRPYSPGDSVDVVIAARVDLDHPVYFPDNKFTDCADCGCELQYRFDVPQKPGGATTFLCICCAARRLREQETT